MAIGKSMEDVERFRKYIKAHPLEVDGDKWAIREGTYIGDSGKISLHHLSDENSVSVPIADIDDVINVLLEAKKFYEMLEQVEVEMKKLEAWGNYDQTN